MKSRLSHGKMNFLLNAYSKEVQQTDQGGRSTSASRRKSCTHVTVFNFIRSGKRPVPSSSGGGPTTQLHKVFMGNLPFDWKEVSDVIDRIVYVSVVSLQGDVKGWLVTQGSLPVRVKMLKGKVWICFFNSTTLLLCAGLYPSCVFN